MARMTAKKKIVGATNRPVGVCETTTLPGLRQIELFGSDGLKRGILLLSKPWVDVRLIDDLKSLFNRHNSSL